MRLRLMKPLIFLLAAGRLACCLCFDTVLRRRAMFSVERENETLFSVERENETHGESCSVARFLVALA
jgi:hypothetical protein